MWYVKHVKILMKLFLSYTFRDHRPPVHLLLPEHAVGDVAAHIGGRPVVGHLLLLLYAGGDRLHRVHRLRAEPALPDAGDARNATVGE